MRVRGRGTVLKCGGVKSPPAPFIELEDGEALALIGLGVAERVEGELPAAENHPEAPAPEPEPETDPAASAEDAEEAPAEPPAPPAGNSDEEPANLAHDQEPTEREQTITDAFELLAGDDLVKTGERAGRPKVSAIEDATGFKDVTADEVDALWANREGAE